MLKIMTTLGALQALAMALSFGRAKIVAVVLGPEGVGVISFIDQVAQLVVHASTFSLPFAAVRFFSQAHSDAYELFQASVSTWLRAVVGLTCGGAAIAVVLVAWRPDLLASEVRSHVGPLILALLSVPGVAIQGLVLNSVAAAQRPTASALLSLAIGVVLTAAISLGTVIAGIGGFYTGSLLAGLFSTAGVLVYAYTKLGINLRHRTRTLREELQRDPSIVRFCLILYGTTFTSPLAYLIARYSVLTAFGEREAGLLQAALGLAGIVSTLLTSAIYLHLMPIVNRNVTAADKIQAALAFEQRLMMMAFAIAMPLVLLSRWFLVTLYSPQFVEASQTLFLFVIAQCILLSSSVYRTLSVGLGDLWIFGLSLGVGQAALGGVSLLLAPAYGIQGVAISLIIAGLVTWMLTQFQLACKHGLRPPMILLGILAYGILALFLSGMAFSQLEQGSPMIILFKCLGYLLFVIGLLFFLTLAERRQLVALSKSFLFFLKDRQFRKPLPFNLFGR